MSAQRRRTKHDHLVHVAHLDRQAQTIERQIRHAVTVARRHGASWDEVGQALAITRQAAWERFRNDG